MEAPDGFEPTVRELQSHALPLGYGAVTFNILPNIEGTVNEDLQFLTDFLNVEYHKIKSIVSFSFAYIIYT